MKLLLTLFIVTILQSFIVCDDRPVYDFGTHKCYEYYGLRICPLPYAWPKEGIVRHSGKTNFSIIGLEDWTTRFTNWFKDNSPESCKARCMPIPKCVGYRSYQYTVFFIPKWHCELIHKLDYDKQTYLTYYHDYIYRLACCKDKKSPAAETQAPAPPAPPAAAEETPAPAPPAAEETPAPEPAPAAEEVPAGEKAEETPPDSANEDKNKETPEINKPAEIPAVSEQPSGESPNKEEQIPAAVPSVSVDLNEEKGSSGKGAQLQSEKSTKPKKYLWIIVAVAGGAILIACVVAFVILKQKKSHPLSKYFLSDVENNENVFNK